METVDVRNYLFTLTKLKSMKSKIIFPKSTLLLTWSCSYEFWLLSTMEYEKSYSIIEEETPNEFDWAIGKNNSFISKWGAFDYSNLNKRYFKFEDSSYYVKK